MKQKSTTVLEKVRNFLMSETFMGIVFVLATLVTITKQEIIGTVGFVLIIAVLMIICDDVIATTLPFLLICCFATKCKGSYDDFIGYLWVIMVTTFAIVFHFKIYKNKKEYSRNNKYYWAMFIVSIAVTLGGVGIITPEEYFSGVSLFNIVGLGFGMLYAYYIMYASFKLSDKYDFSERFSKIMILTALFACFMIIHHYIIHWDSFIAKPRILQFQWRNNISTMLMLTMPFPFYMSTKKTPYFFLGLVSYGCILLAGSRGGMLFGGIEFLICIVTLIVVDKKKRKFNIAVLASIIGIVLIVTPELTYLLKKTFQRFTSSEENYIRIGLYKRAIEDFNANPVFGRGLGYFGNRDIHKSAKFALCWYHSSIFQIIGSFGVVGIIAYLYQLIIRLKIFQEKRKNYFMISIFIAYIGLELMSLVNPGIFSPIPYLLIVTIFFIVMQKCNTQKDMDEYVKLKKGDFKSKSENEKKSKKIETNTK